MKPLHWVILVALVLLLIGGSIVLGQGYKKGEPFEVRLKSIGGGLFLEETAANAWLAMRDAAAVAGLSLAPSGSGSAFRTLDQQETMIGARGAYGAGGFAAKAGYSPHQAGNAVDVACVSPGTANYDPLLDTWLTDNAPSFGWYRVGLNFKTREPWHLEYKYAT